jgi:hypothetical protein
MPAGSAVRNRSETVTVVTPRGEVEVVRQEMRGLRRGSSWAWFWLAPRSGSGGWSEASTAREAIRRAVLLPPRKPPAWLNRAAAQAERELTAAETDADAAEGASGPSEAPAVDNRDEPTLTVLPADVADPRMTLQPNRLWPR